MKRVSIIIATALATTLAIGMMAGCSSQSSSSSAASGSTSSAASSSASSAAEQSQDKIIAELKDALADAPSLKSVTVTEVLTTLYTNSSGFSDSASSSSAAQDDPETLEFTTVYKFDMSGDSLKTSMIANVADIQLQYISDGDDAVCVTDQAIYAGTTDQFELAHFDGVDAYVTDAIGELNTIVDCIDTISKTQEGDITVYELTLDTEKYIQSDEILGLLADYGDPVLSAVFTICFDKNGHMVLLVSETGYKQTATTKALTFSDFDSTVVDPLPEADKSYEEMEEDIDAKLDALLEEESLS